MNNSDHSDRSDRPDYSANLQPFLESLEADEVSPGITEASARSGLPSGRIVMLGRNENPYGPSPRALEALCRSATNRYPEPQEFIKAAAAYAGYPAGNVIAGAGMDEVISNVARLFLGPGDKALIPAPTYSYYAVAVGLCGARPLYVQRSQEFDMPEEMPAEVIPDAKIYFICSPNNPTGNVTAEEKIRDLLESTRGIVFLDEAYAEFAEGSLIHLVKDYENLIVGRTMSKAFGLAGLRLGYAVAPEWIADEYRRVAPMFSLSAPSIAGGAAALEDLEHMRSSVSKIVKERERVCRSLVGAHPSSANFIYVETPGRSSTVAGRLLSKGVIVKDCSTMPGAGDRHIRVTIGTPEENDRFLEAYSSVV